VYVAGEGGEVGRGYLQAQENRFGDYFRVIDYVRESSWELGRMHGKEGRERTVFHCLCVSRQLKTPQE
jgi:hypothetical protein